MASPAVWLRMGRYCRNRHVFVSDMCCMPRFYTHINVPLVGMRVNCASGEYEGAGDISQFESGQEGLRASQQREKG